MVGVALESSNAQHDQLDNKLECHNHQRYRDLYPDTFHIVIPVSLAQSVVVIISIYILDAPSLHNIYIRFLLDGGPGI